ncbi:tripartite tricarboxylate transporter substrate binding protein [Pantoea sp. 18069]|uniref:Bug family tripartite tricarboxylate transporter substrate binding protein n=1 Tax=Pantoea sp. 18069 TaxID=2681415 RepID=UPI00135B56AF|nr:tripartite tricarboxylate transporter substrate binding protein [Pantoea sp. 18069]
MFNCNRRLMVGTCAVALASPALTLAQAKYPSRAIRFISPAPPGGLSDTIPRTLATDIAVSIGVPVTVENRGGAGGSIATSTLTRSPADGYSLLLGTGGMMTLNPFFIPNLPFDVRKDFVGLALVAFSPLYLAVRADAPYRNLADLVAASKAAPGQLAYGHLGNGSTAAVAAAMLAKAKGLDLIDVPYAGYAPALTELLAGRLAFCFVDGNSLSRIEQGSLRALAVTTAQRSPRLPEVPSLKELDVNVDMSLWFGVYARAGTPPDAALRLRDEIRRATASQAFRAQLHTFGLEPGTLFGEDFQKFHLAELDRWARTLPTLGIKGLV